ncbi:Dihydropteroate synthase-like protein [Myxozyma melibiosi]|uniref:Dihydropteroate synthase-like protein n=1 Tax=Myxozyma melibiosi TaxID=54550 RepID=A0ABR1FAK1_9ASCO
MSAPPLLPPDSISVQGLALTTLKAGHDTWHRAPRPQPVLIDCAVRAPVALAGISDLVSESVHYGILTKAITSAVEASPAPDFTPAQQGTGRALAHEVVDSAFGVGAEHVSARLAFPKKLLRADAAGWQVVKHRYTPYGSAPVTKEVDEFAFIENLRVYTVIGVNPWERLEKQEVVVSVDMRTDEPAEIDIVKIADGLVEQIEASAYLTIEALVSALTRYLCVDHALSSASVRALKPRAIAFASGPSVSITRTKRFYSTEAARFSSVDPTSHIAYLGLGSNLGDSAALLSAALDELEKRGIKVLRTSSMYETAPMYVENQPRFLNAVCKVSTTLSPHDLLRAVQDVEKNALGRVKLIDKGPRTIDIDIELYDDIVMRDGAVLSIPHLSMLEREFVLRPLVEIAPEYVHPVTMKTIAEHFEHLCPPATFVSEMYSVVPLKTFRGSSKQMLFDTVHHVRTPTYVMGILNITPDSFSDGGKNEAPDSMLASAREFVAANPDMIIDIGGQSTNPKSVDPGPEVEAARVVPAIKLLREQPEFVNTIISVDTFYASVARAAIEAGADIINDVSAGALDADMLATAAALDVPIILMHMRGTPQTMTSLTTYDGDDVVEGVAAELARQVRAAEDAGVKRWNMILDPGLGFAKTQEQNLTVLRELAYLMRSRRGFEGLPWLVGPSRKAFIGRITGAAKASDRVFGTGAAVAASIVGGADILRVHDVKEMTDVVKVMDSIYKRPEQLRSRRVEKV